MFSAIIWKYPGGSLTCNVADKSTFGTWFATLLASYLGADGIETKIVGETARFQVLDGTDCYKALIDKMILLDV